MPHGRRIGCVRVNTLCRSAPPQLEGMSFDALVTDSIRRKNQLLAQFHAMMRYVRAGDTLFVQSIDRLGRSPQEFLSAGRDLTRDGVSVECVSEGLVFPAGESPLMRNLLLLIMIAFHHAVESWTSELRSEARRHPSA